MFVAFQNYRFVFMLNNANDVDFGCSQNCGMPTKYYLCTVEI